jgi:tripartite-type tricarboxylate transporter receptor subunit TctC
MQKELKMKRVLVLMIALLALTMGLSSASLADGYPSKPIKVIVPFGAGGETDIVARMVAKELEKVLGSTVVVQNIAGASGMTGCRTIATAKPDGYTLGVIPAAPLAMHPHMRKVPYTFDTFQYIGRVIKSPYLVFVAKDSPWNSIADMAADMKANPNKYFWASAGVGSVPYFAGTGLLKALEVKAKHVPFTGDATALQAMAGNRAHFYTTTAGVLKKFDVKALAILDADRSTFNPEIPSIKEAGKEVYISQWMPLVAPKGLPKDVLAKLSGALAKVCKSDNFKATMNKMGLAIAYLPPAETRDFVASESARNEVNIKAMKKKK